MEEYSLQWCCSLRWHLVCVFLMFVPALLYYTTRVCWYPLSSHLPLQTRVSFFLLIENFSRIVSVLSRGSVFALTPICSSRLLVIWILGVFPHRYSHFTFSLPGSGSHRQLNDYPSPNLTSRLKNAPKSNSTTPKTIFLLAVISPFFSPHTILHVKSDVLSTFS